MIALAPQPRDLTGAIRASVQHHPNRVAVRDDRCALTYAELDGRADGLAAALRRIGVDRESRVALFAERSAASIAGVVAIQRAGGAYVPIDSASPDERISFLLRDSAPSALVCDEHGRSRLPAAPPIPVLDLEAPDADARSWTAAADPSAASLAYMIYTSGSTGTPKGVLIEHGSVMHLLAGMESLVKMGPGDVLVSVAPLAFDMSVLDVFWPLTTGATLVVASREHARRPSALIELLESSRATHMQATPSAWRMLVEAGWRGSAGFTAITGGEALSAALADALLERAGAVWNLYGPTETTVWATAWQVTRRGERPTIGVPLAGVDVSIADESGAEVEPGTTGELCIAGPGVARGYHLRPELTAERFVMRTSAGGRAQRWYRTGDLGQRNDDGTIAFLGRNDFQVKLRGHRVELGEIEAALERLPEIRSAVAVVRNDVPDDPRLVAYVIPAPDARFARGVLRRALRATLPAYMVPDAIVPIEAFPLNENGKIERRALPPPLAEPPAGAFVAPRTPLEARLASIWETSLQLAPIGVTDDVFDLGVTSIAVARVVERIERELGIRLSLAPLFTAPTIEKLAQVIDRGETRRWTSLVPIQPTGRRLPIFGCHGGAGTILHFHDLAARLGDDRPLYAFQMRGLYGDRSPHLDVPSMAAHYIAEMREVQPRGPYALVGYCFGGIVAFEMAQQLTRAGEQIALLASVNGPSPGYIRRFGGPRAVDPTEPIAPTDPLGAAVFALKRRWWAAQYEARTGWRERAFDLRTRWYARRGRSLPDAWRELANFRICAVAERSYRARPYAGDMLVIYAESLYRTPDLGWAPLVRGSLATYGMSGYHQNQRDAMFEPKVASVAARLLDGLPDDGEHGVSAWRT